MHLKNLTRFIVHIPIIDINYSKVFFYENDRVVNSACILHDHHPFVR